MNTTFPIHLTGQAARTIPPEVFATGCLALGLVMVFLGWSFYRIALMGAGAAVGFAIGRATGMLLPLGFNALYIAVPLALLLGIGALMVEKLGAFLLGGALAAGPATLFLMERWHGVGRIAVAGLLAFMVGGLLMVLLWRPVIVISLAVLGAAMAANGTLLIVEHVRPHWAARVASAGRPWLAAAVGLLALCGVLFQTCGEGATGRNRAEKG